MLFERSPLSLRQINSRVSTLLNKFASCRDTIQVFDILKRGYVDTISNPFYSFGTKLGTYNRFNAAVQAALAVPSGGKA